MTNFASWNGCALWGCVLSAGVFACASTEQVPVEEFCLSDTCATRQYVVDQIAYPPTDVEGRIVGFDIDGSDDTVCMQEDRHSPPPESEASIDNSFGPFLGSLLGENLETAVNAGREILIVEVSGIDSFTSDGNVAVSAFLAHARGGVDLLRDEDGTLAPGQTFDVQRASFEESSSDSPRFHLGEGRIVNGRLRARGGDLPMYMPLMGVDVVVPGRRAQLAADITATRLNNGVWGAEVSVAETDRTFQETPALAEYAQTFAMILASFADSAPNNAGSCLMTSLASTFAADEAALSDAVVD